MQCHKGGVARQHLEAAEVVRGGLVELRVPYGLADVLAQDDSRIALRIYLLDNSGSMNEADGNVMIETPGNVRPIVRPSTRWEEICTFAVDHARFNWSTGTPCEFVLLNSLGRTPGTSLQDGRDFVRIDQCLGDESSQLNALERLLKNNSPRGVTPLTQRLEEILHRVKRECSGLAQLGQVISLTIATDGLPTTPNSGTSTPADQQHLVEQLRQLGAVLPLQLVIRLCTDDRSIIDFYNGIDEELEIPLDIIDDMSSEAIEVIRENKNDWFAYTPLLHRIREAGTLCKVLDTIDERPLRPQEVRYLAELLSGSVHSLSNLSDKEFINEMQRLVESSPQVYDAATQDMRPVLNVAKLRVAMKVGFRGKVLFPCFPCLA